MRHLNEIVRERNQYSRDATEAWQDFINLKGRMDTELAKVSKRNNFLVEELESWKQQFLKFQAFAEQLTKETQDLKVKIENHKRENRRLTSLIDQQTAETTRITARLAGTEKQRDDALEALVLQQEIAEELERERKRNKGQLSALQDTNSGLLRQRDEAQRVVLHLRALIDGQAHHMEHIVKSLSQAPELEEMYQEVGEDGTVKEAGALGSIRGAFGIKRTPSQTLRNPASTTESRSSSRQSMRIAGEKAGNSKLQMSDVADRYLRDKTDSITYIIRNISEQCAAAVEGLQLAQRAEGTEHARHTKKSSESEMTQSLASEMDDGSVRGFRNSVPPTPDLIHANNNRSSTAMSTTTEGTVGRDNVSPQPDVKTRIAMQDEDTVRLGDESAQDDNATISKETAHSAFNDTRMGAYGSA